MPHCGAAESVVFKISNNSTTVYTKSSVDLSAEGNDTIDVGKISGEAHSGIEDNGTADSVRTYSDNNCSTETSSQTTQPADAGGVDYAVYFEDDDGVIYQKVVKDATSNYTTCGNSVAGATLSSQEATVDLTIQLTGTVHLDIDRIAVAGDGTSDGTSADTVTAYVDVSAGTSTYYLYSATSTDLQNSLDASSNVFFVESGALTTELVERTKDLTATSTTVHVGRVTGSLHDNLRHTHAADEAEVYSDSSCSTELSSEDRITATTSATYTQYYEQKFHLQYH